MSLPLLAVCAFDWRIEHVESVRESRHGAWWRYFVPWSWYKRCTIKDCNSIPQVHCFHPSLLYPRKDSGRMSTGTGYPIPVDELGFPFNDLLQGIQMDRRTQGGCGQWWESSANLHMLQWQSQCFYSMTTVSKYETILLGMDHWWCNGQFLLWIKRFLHHFLFLCSFPDNSITPTQIKHIWVYLVYIPPNMADTAIAETSKLDDINIIICIRANFLDL